MTVPAENPSLSDPLADPLSVAVRGARLVFDGVPLFDGLDFDLAAGAWTCLLGASGVGKTSLLRLIAGLAEPAPGTTITCGDGGPVAGRAAYMAQQAGLADAGGAEQAGRPAAGKRQVERLEDGRAAVAQGRGVQVDRRGALGRTRGGVGCHGLRLCQMSNVRYQVSDFTSP